MAEERFPSPRCASAIQIVRPSRRRAWSSLFPLEDVALPRTHVQVKPARLEVVSVAFVNSLAQQISQPPPATSHVIKRGPDVTLAGMVCVIHRDQQTLTLGILPGKRDKCVGGPVAIPRGDAFCQLQLPLPNGGLSQDTQQLPVELTHACI